MELQSYLNRIGFEGVPKVDVDTLKRLHRRHLLSISYENLDIQLGRTVHLDAEAIFSKLVNGRRGGWCYEMNGLLEWALREIGFDVMRMNSGVGRVERGDDAIGNHLVLLVRLDEPWIADVGFGDGIIEPIPLREADIEQRGFRYRLERIADGFWRFHNHQYSGAPSFDFRPEPADEGLFEAKCNFLQTASESPFVASLVCQRFTEDGYQVQLGRVARRVTPRGTRSWLLRDGAELVDRLRGDFELDVPQAASLWPRIARKHKELFGRTST